MEQLKSTNAAGYTYDHADNLTSLRGSTQGYDAANEVCWSLPVPSGSPTCSSAGLAVGGAVVHYAYGSGRQCAVAIAKAGISVVKAGLASPLGEGAGAAEDIGRLG